MIKTPLKIAVALTAGIVLGLVPVTNAVAAEATYQPGPASTHDYRDVSTLSHFTRLVYKDRWQGIAAADVLEQLSGFKNTTASPMLREIWRDVLLGDFSGMVIQDNVQQALVMAERIRLLNQLGYFDEAVRLYQQAATMKPVPENIVRQGVDALALSGSADGACLEITMAARTITGPYWTQDAAMCSAYFGEQAAADTLFSEAAPGAGKNFEPVYRMLSGEEKKQVNAPLPALWRTLLLTQGATVEPGYFKDADTVTMASLAASRHVPLDTRLVAASRAADHGAIASERLRLLYETKYPEDKNVDALVATALADGNLSQEQYYTAARFTFGGKERATIVKNGINALAPSTGIKSQVYGWIVDKLTLQVNTLGWFAPQGYANMVMTNRAASAKMYYDAGDLAATPWALVNALQNNDTWSQQDEGRWEKAMRDKNGKDAAAKIADYLYLAKAYDQENKLSLFTPSESPEGITVPTTLNATLERGGRGLTLLAALNIFGTEKQLSKFDNRMFANIIQVMTREGLYGERKKITLEFLIQSML